MSTVPIYPIPPPPPPPPRQNMTQEEDRQWLWQTAYARGAAEAAPMYKVKQWWKSKTHAFNAVAVAVSTAVIQNADSIRELGQWGMTIAVTFAVGNSVIRQFGTDSKLTK